MHRRAVPLPALAAIAILAFACSRNAAAPPTPEPTATETATPPTSRLQLAAALVEAPDAGAGSREAAPWSLAGKTILHAGDSMVGGNWGLTRALEAKIREHGGKLVRHYKVSETVASFAKGEALGELLARHDPDIVILTLGTNDVFVPHPQAYAAHVRAIAERIAPRECWWIGPPTWKPDTGIVKVIEENSAPCRFFDSTSLDLERTSDGIHPTDRGGAEWAQKFWVAFSDRRP